MNLITQLLKCVMMLALMVFSHQMLAQGVTTGAISGVITDAKGETLPGANVVAVHNPTGTRYATATRADGRYNLPNVRVGGPYTITASFVGYREQTRSNVTVALGQEYTADFTLQSSDVQLNEVQVTATRNAVISADRTGAATNVRREQFERLPTITRSIQDFSSLDPRAGRDFTFGGRSNQYSNFTIDGATSNNVFGLSALPGGQSNAQPVSVDAIQEISVALAPYDVRQGAFTGAGVNAVTRSGTNEFSGSVYGFYRNQSMVGKKIEGVEQSLQNFSFYNTGFRLGGPIVKNKLFFFVNAEIEKRADPAVVFPADAPKNQQTSAELSRLRNFLTTTQPGKTWTFDPGTFENFDALSAANKFLAKIDWNISDVHRLSVRYNQLDSYRDVAPSNSGGFGSSPPGGRQNSNNALPFSNTWYRINNNSQAVIAELNSTFGNRFSNTLQVGYTAFRDFRQAAGGNPPPNFPLVDILGPNGQTLTSFGAEPFTVNNRLDQDIFQFNDNFTFYLKNHVVTVGTANEYFRFNNVFTPQINGVYQFNSVSDFIGNVTNPIPTGGSNNFASQYLLQYSAIPGDPAPGAKWSAMQLGLYAQDEYTAIKNLKLTAGLRVDAPVFLSTLPNNTVSDALTFANGEKIQVGQLPKTTPLFSPRVGFNWDVLGDKTLQLRGGTGIFTGRVPFVWISNQVGNNGLFFGTIQTRNQQETATLNSQGITGRFNPNPPVPTLPPNQPGVPIAQTFTINSTVNNFKFPQVFRTNIAIDKTLPGGLVATLEGIYTKDVNAIFIRDANLVTPTATLPGDGRPLYPGGNANRVNPARIVQALVLDNTNQGYSWSVTAQLQKTFSNGFYASAAYTYTDSRDINSQSGSTAGGLFTGNQIVDNPNSPTLSYSSNLTPHRVVASASYRKEYLKNFATTLSFIYTGSNYNGAGFGGSNFSYTYGGSPNNDGINNNDLIYIPRNQSEILLTTTDADDTRTVDQIWQQLDAYISQDKYLDSRRGQYAARNGGVAPWYNSLNARLLQDFFIETGSGKRNTLQLSVEVVNVLNMLNSSWGLAKQPARASLLQFANYEATNGRPVYSFSRLTDSFITTNNILSRWQLQVGLRYTFN